MPVTKFLPLPTNGYSGANPNPIDINSRADLESAIRAQLKMTATAPLVLVFDGRDVSVRNWGAVGTLTADPCPALTYTA